MFKKSRPSGTVHRKKKGSQVVKNTIAAHDHNVTFIGRNLGWSRWVPWATGRSWLQTAGYLSIIIIHGKPTTSISRGYYNTYILGPQTFIFSCFLGSKGLWCLKWLSNFHVRVILRFNMWIFRNVFSLTLAFVSIESWLFHRGPYI